MKNLLLFFFIFFLLYKSYSQIPLDTAGGRYRNLIFDSVLVKYDVLYSRSLNSLGQMQDLVLDVYEPYSDVLQARPFMVLVHGGSFLHGNKSDMASTCIHFAKKGYVAVSIQYRLGYTSFTAVGAFQTVIRATQDLKNAIRFLRKSAAGSNPYRIQPEYAFAGGVSAGSMTALHAAYMDQLSEILPGQTIPNLDSLHNAGQIPGYEWKFKAVINIAGAIGDTNWIKAGDVPVTSFHGTADEVVPYESGSFGGAFALFGSRPIFLRAQHLGLISELRPFPGAGHDYSSGNPSATDTTLARITRFLFPFLISPTTTKSQEIKTREIDLYKVPSGWKLVSINPISEVQLFDLQGRILERKRVGEEIVLIAGTRQGRILKMISEKGEVKSWVLVGGNW